MSNTIPNNTAIYTSNLMVGKNNILDPFSAIGTFPVTAAILQPRKGNFSPTTLGSTEKTYNGNQGDVSQIALWAANLNYSYTVQEQQGGLFSITLTVPYDEITNTDNLVEERVQWEITENVVNRDIFDAGIFTTNTAGLLITSQRYTVPPFIRAAIREALKYGSFGSLNFGTINGTTLTKNQVNALAPLKTIANQFYYMIKSGVTSVKSATIHVRRTAVYSTMDPNAYDANPYYNQLLSPGAFQVTNINPIISRADLIRLFNPDPVTTNQLLPSYSIAKSIQGPPWNDPVTSYALGGYLVHVPIREFITPTKIKVVQLYEFDEWLDTNYTRFSPISDFPLIGTTPYPPGYSGFPNS